MENPCVVHGFDPLLLSDTHSAGQPSGSQALRPRPDLGPEPEAMSQRSLRRGFKMYEISLELLFTQNVCRNVEVCGVACCTTHTVQR